MGDETAVDIAGLSECWAETRWRVTGILPDDASIRLTAPGAHEGLVSDLVLEATYPDGEFRILRAQGSDEAGNTFEDVFDDAGGYPDGLAPVVRVLMNGLREARAASAQAARSGDA